MFVKDNIIEIKKIDSNKKMQLMLNNVDLYVCKTTEDEFGININDNIIYKIDDILIYDNREYLILKNLKKYPIGEEIFWVSLNCTLADIEKFNSIWFKNPII